MPVCLDCANYVMRASPQARHGMYTCKVSPPWEYPSPLFERECDKFTPADEVVVELRIKHEAKGNAC